MIKEKLLKRWFLYIRAYIYDYIYICSRCVLMYKNMQVCIENASLTTCGLHQKTHYSHPNLWRKYIAWCDFSKKEGGAFNDTDSYTASCHFQWGFFPHSKLSKGFTHAHMLKSLLRCLNDCSGQQLPFQSQGKLVFHQQTLWEASGLPHCCFRFCYFFLFSCRKLLKRRSSPRCLSKPFQMYLTGLRQLFFSS